MSFKCVYAKDIEDIDSCFDCDFKKYCEIYMLLMDMTAQRNDKCPHCNTRFGELLGEVDCKE